MKWFREGVRLVMAWWLLGSSGSMPSGARVGSGFRESVSLKDSGLDSVFQFLPSGPVPRPAGLKVISNSKWRARLDAKCFPPMAATSSHQVASGLR